MSNLLQTKELIKRLITVTSKTVDGDDGKQRQEKVCRLSDPDALLTSIQSGDTPEARQLQQMLRIYYGSDVAIDVPKLRQFFYDCYGNQDDGSEVKPPKEKTDRLVELLDRIGVSKHFADELNAGGESGALDPKIVNKPEYISRNWRRFWNGLGWTLAIGTAIGIAIPIIALAGSTFPLWLLVIIVGLTFVNNIYGFWDTIPKTLRELLTGRFFRKLSGQKRVLIAFFGLCVICLSICTVAAMFISPIVGLAVIAVLTFVGVFSQNFIDIAKTVRTLSWQQFKTGIRNRFWFRPQRPYESKWQYWRYKADFIFSKWLVPAAFTGIVGYASYALISGFWLPTALPALIGVLGLAAMPHVAAVLLAIIVGAIIVRAIFPSLTSIEVSPFLVNLIKLPWRTLRLIHEPWKIKRAWRLFKDSPFTSTKNFVKSLFTTSVNVGSSVGDFFYGSSKGDFAGVANAGAAGSMGGYFMMLPSEGAERKQVLLSRIASEVVNTSGNKALMRLYDNVEAFYGEDLKKRTGKFVDAVWFSRFRETRSWSQVQRMFKLQLKLNVLTDALKNNNPQMAIEGLEDLLKSNDPDNTASGLIKESRMNDREFHARRKSKSEEEIESLLDRLHNTMLSNKCTSYDALSVNEQAKKEMLDLLENEAKALKAQGQVLGFPDDRQQKEQIKAKYMHKLARIANSDQNVDADVDVQEKKSSAERIVEVLNLDQDSNQEASDEIKFLQRQRNTFHSIHTETQSWYEIEGVAKVCYLQAKLNDILIQYNKDINPFSYPRKDPNETNKKLIAELERFRNQDKFIARHRNRPSFWNRGSTASQRSIHKIITEIKAWTHDDKSVILREAINQCANQTKAIEQSVEPMATAQAPAAG